MPTLRDAFDFRMSDFDTAAAYSEEIDCLLQSINNTGEIIEKMFGEREAAAAMAALRGLLAGTTDSNSPQEVERTPLAWRKEDFCAEHVASWPPLFHETRALRGFAEYGVFTPWDDAGTFPLQSPRADLLRKGSDIPSWVSEITARIEDILALAPPAKDAPYAPYGDLLTIVAQARARVKFDLGEPITPQDLADLSGVTLKRIQNAAYEKGEGAPVFDGKGFVTADSARAWLVRKGFRFSIWREIAALDPHGDDWGRDVEAPADALVNDDLGENDTGPAEADYIFVPVAADQSRFYPDMRREDGYQVGPKGAERTFDDYFEALGFLQRQAAPYWRRPNANGHWGIVSGRGWERMLRSELAASAHLARK